MRKNIQGTAIENMVSTFRPNKFKIRQNVIDETHPFSTSIFDSTATVAAEVAICWADLAASSWNT